jgi:hypothetical protein
MVGADAVADQETRATRRGGLCPSRLPTLPESRPEVIMLGAAERTSGRYAATWLNSGMMSSPYALSVSSCP